MTNMDRQFEADLSARLEPVVATGMDASSKSTPAVSKLLKVWENRQAQQAARVGGLGLMAVSLAACGGSSETDDDTDDGDDDVVVPVGRSFVLTDNADVITGTDGDDSISGTSGSIDGDTISAAAGTDTLSVTVSVADDDNASFAASGLEVLQIRGTGAAAGEVDLDLGDVAGLTSLVFRRMAEDVTVTNLQDLDTAITIEDTANAASNVIVNFDAAQVSGSADTASLTVDNTTAGADFTINGVETIAITAVGDDNDIDIDGDDLETVTIAGSGEISIDVDASATTVDASANTGGVTVNFTAAADVEATGGSGADTFNMGATFTDDDVLDGGAGVDTLNIAAFNTTATESYSADNIETLRIETDDTAGGAAEIIDLDLFSSDFTTVRVDVGTNVNGNSITLQDVDNASAILVTNNAAGTDAVLTALNVTLTSDTGTADSATITLTGNGNDAGIDLTVTTLNVDEVETVNLALNATSDGTIAVGAITANEIDTLNVSGAAGAELGSVTALTIVTISAASATGDIEINLGAADHVVTGGSGDDTFTFAGNLDSDDEVDGGAGDDTLTASLAAGTTQADLTFVETIVLDIGVAGITFSGSSVTGTTSIEVDAASDEAVSIVNLGEAVATVRLGATAAGAAGDAATIRWSTGSDSSHEVAIGDNTATAAGDVDTGAVTISGNAGALTIRSDAFTGNSVYAITANTATTLAIVTEEDLEIDTANGGTGILAATAADVVAILSDGGNLVVDGAQTITGAETISIDAADGNITLTGAMTATAATSLTVTATDDFLQTGNFVSDADVDTVSLTAAGISASIIYDGILDVDHVRAISLNAMDGGLVRVDDIELLGVDNDGTTNITTTISISATGTDANDVGSTVTVGAINVASAATLDSVTITGDEDSTVNFTVGGANLTITAIDASAMEGEFNFDSSTSGAAIDLTTGDGTNDITTELDQADEITLAVEAGSDTINVLDDTTAADVVYNFEAGADGDVVEIDVSALGTGAENFASTALDASLIVSIGTDDDGVLVNADDTLVATNNILRLTDTFADITAVYGAIDLDAETNVGGLADNDVILVLWTNGADSFLSTVTLNGPDGADADAGADLIQFVGVTVTDLHADNFVFV